MNSVDFPSFARRAFEAGIRVNPDGYVPGTGLIRLVRFVRIAISRLNIPQIKSRTAPEPASPNFHRTPGIRLEISPDRVEHLLRQGLLHVSDFHCLDPYSKQRVQRFFLVALEYNLTRVPRPIRPGNAD